MAVRKPAPVEEPLEIEEPDPADESADEVEEPGVPIYPDGIRASVNSWWCPNDDTSMPHDMNTCPTCGFIRP